MIFLKRLKRPPETAELSACAVGNEKILTIRVDRDAVTNSVDSVESEDAFWLAKPIGAAFTVL